MSEATRIEQMLHTTEKQNFELSDVINGCMQGYQQIYPNVDFNYKSDFKHSINSNKTTTALILFGAPEHIAQLLDKVISNAVEFSDDQNIIVKLVQKKSSVKIIIENNGPQLPEQMQERLFDSMVSVRNSHQQSQPHLGLGLYIARLICEFHLGKISALNHSSGVKIVIELPLNKTINEP